MTETKRTLYRVGNAWLFLEDVRAVVWTEGKFYNVSLASVPKPICLYSYDGDFPYFLAAWEASRNPVSSENETVPAPENPPCPS